MSINFFEIFTVEKYRRRARTLQISTETNQDLQNNGPRKKSQQVSILFLRRLLKKIWTVYTDIEFIQVKNRTIFNNKTV